MRRRLVWDKLLDVLKDNVSIFSVCFLYLLIIQPTVSVVYWAEFLTIHPEVRVRFPELPDFLRSSGSETESTQHREYN
jgi:hypothetical protein